jgi:membrane protein DedA with SNARE-associated domain
MPASLISHQGLDQLVATYGYLAVAVGVGLESMGVPLPGETLLVLAAIYAGGHADLNIWLVGLAAALGAIAGDNIGYWLGMRYGYPLLRRFGWYAGLSDRRIKVGQYLFLCHGRKVVFLGRFVALLRILAAFLAGVNRMRWSDFMLANALGGVVWAGVFALGGYTLGTIIFRLEGILAPIVFAAACAVFFGCGYLFVKIEDDLQERAERALPGPLR